MSSLTATAPDGVRLHVRSDGDTSQPCLLLLNSLGTDHTLWDPQVPAWAADHHVLRFDQRGHGRSAAPDGPYSVAQLGRDALAVLDAHDVERTDLCGISLGGLVALEVAAAAPQRVRRVVLANTAARVGTEQAWRERAALVRSKGMDAVADLVLARFFSPAFRAGGHPAVAHVEQCLRTLPPTGYAASCEALATADLRDATSAVQAPALVVVGTADEATPPVDGEALAASLPRARLAELRGAGHLSNLEQPERFAELVGGFLSAERDVDA